jgi:putative phosphoribosyl transferase
MPQDIITDRKEAGLLLAEKLMKYKGEDAIVLAIPRGGVPVGYYIAEALNVPLDVVLSKKIGHPLNPEFAIGSVSEDSVIIDSNAEVPAEYIQGEIEKIKKQLREKHKLFAGHENLPEIKNKIVIIVDDGIATGNTLLATVNMLRKKKPAKIVVASPLVPYDRAHKIQVTADDFVYLFAPRYFPGVGAFYKSFEQVSDEEVIRLLNKKRNTSRLLSGTDDDDEEEKDEKGNPITDHILL